MEFTLFQIGDTEEAKDKNGNTYLALTKKGKNEVTASAEGLNRLIPRKVKVQVWSGMFPAASETAELIAEELGVKRKFLKIIDSNDLPTVLSTAFTNSIDDHIVIVGSRANLEAWILNLTGIILPFVASAAAGIAVYPETPNKADLLWFVLPKYLKNIS